MEGQGSQRAVKTVQAAPTAQRAGKVVKKTEHVNEGANLWTDEERKMFVQKFDIYKFENRIRQLITEAIHPITVDQVEVFKKQEDFRNQQEVLTCVIRDAKDELRRSNEIIKELKRFDADFASLSKRFVDFKDYTQVTNDLTDQHVGECQTDIQRLELELEQVQSTCRQALNANKIDTSRLAEMINQYKNEMEMYLVGHAQDLGLEMSKVDQNYKTMESRCMELMGKYDICHDAMQKSDVHVLEFQRSLDQAYKKMESLKDLHTYGKRIKYLEDECRQMRMLTQQNILETKNSMNTAISRREMDEIILKFNFEMLDEMFGKKLEDDIQKNVDLKSQIKTNYTRWKMMIKGRYDGQDGQQNSSGKGPMISSIYSAVQLPGYGGLRKEYLLNELNAGKVYQVSSKFNKWGLVRQNSLDNADGGDLMAPKKSLVEIPIRLQDFQCVKPKNYQPRFLPKKRKVTFEELSAEPSVAPEDKKAGAKDPKGKGKETGSKPGGNAKAPSSSPTAEEAAAQIGLEKQKPMAKAKYMTSKMKKDELAQQKAAELDSRLEVWNGRKIPTDQGIVKRKFNFKRQHSNEGKGKGILMHGKWLEPVVKEHVDELVVKPEDVLIPDLMNIGGLRIRSFYHLSMGAAHAQSQRAGHPSMILGNEKSQPFSPRPMLESAAGMDARATTGGWGQPAMQTQQGSNGRRRKKTADQLDMDLVKWGDATMEITPPAPKGMQFVNLDSIVDLHDLEDFKKLYSEEIAEDFERRFVTLKQSNTDDIHQGKLEIEQEVHEVCQAMRNENKALIHECMMDLRNLSSSQDGKIEEIRKFMQDQSYLMRVEVARKFVEQAKLNEAQNERIQIMIKKILTIKNDCQMVVSEVKNASRQTQMQMDEHEEEFNRLLRMNKSIVEVLFLECSLQIQDEFDRHQMSLWSLKEAKDSQALQGKAGPKAEGQVEPQYQLDEDCLSCSLDKYRPMIKEAFKMACIQYKPSYVPFRGLKYDRKQLVEVKEKLLRESWFDAMENMDFYKTMYKTNNGTIVERRANFLDHLNDRLQRSIVPANDKNHGVVDELVINKSLQEQILKNPSNMGLLYGQANDQISLQMFKQEVSDEQSMKKLNEKMSIVSIMTQDSKANNTKRNIDRKTQLLINKLKDQSSKYRRGAGVFGNQDTISGREQDNTMQKSNYQQQWRRRSQGDIPADAPSSSGLADNLRIQKIEQTERKNTSKRFHLTSKKETMKLTGEMDESYLQNRQYANASGRELDISIEEAGQTQEQFNQTSKYHNLDNGIDGSSRMGLTPTQKNQATRITINSALQKSKMPFQSMKQSRAGDYETNRSSLPDIKLKHINDSHVQFSQQVSHDDFESNQLKELLTEYREQQPFASQKDLPELNKFQLKVKTKAKRDYFDEQLADYNQIDQWNAGSRMSSDRRRDNGMLQNSPPKASSLAKESKNYVLSKDISDALTNLQSHQKKKLLMEVKSNNYDLKIMDNVAVKSSIKNIRHFQNIDKKTKRNQELQTPVQLKISALQASKVRGGNGYLYSQGRNSLMQDIKTPFKNQETSPLKSLQNMYDSKNWHLQTQSNQDILKQLELAGTRQAQQQMQQSQKVIEHTKQMQSSVSIEEKSSSPQHQSDDAQTLNQNPSYPQLIGDSSNRNNGYPVLPQKNMVLNERSIDFLHKDGSRMIIDGDQVDQADVMMDNVFDSEEKMLAQHLDSYDQEKKASNESKRQQDLQMRNSRNLSSFQRSSNSRQRHQHQNSVHPSAVPNEQERYSPTPLRQFMKESAAKDKVREEERKAAERAFYALAAEGDKHSNQANHHPVPAFDLEVDPQQLDSQEIEAEYRQQQVHYQHHYDNTQELLLDFGGFQINQEDLEIKERSRPSPAVRMNKNTQDDGRTYEDENHLAQDSSIQTLIPSFSQKQTLQQTTAAPQHPPADSLQQIRNLQQFSQSQLQGHQGTTKTRDMVPHPEQAADQQPPRKAFKLKHGDTPIQRGGEELGAATAGNKRPAVANLSQITGFDAAAKSAQSRAKLGERFAERK